MASAKFKTGDIIQPIAGKKTSNHMHLDKLVSCQVETNSPLNYGKREITVRITEGVSKSSWSTYNTIKGNVMTVFEDAFELINDPKKELYEVY
jgi:hypothetical protein